jgi:hypothetical protein
LYSALIGVRPFVRPSVRLFACLLVRSFVRSFVCLSAFRRVSAFAPRRFLNGFDLKQYVQRHGFLSEEQEFPVAAVAAAVAVASVSAPFAAK